MIDWFVIKDLQSFIDATRTMVFVNFNDENEEKSDNVISIDDLSKTDQDELNKLLSYDEAFMVAKPHFTKQKNKRTSEIRYTLSESNYIDIVSDMNSRMISNIMTQLVNKGLVETAFDEKSNDFIFWVKDEYKQQKDSEAD